MKKLTLKIISLLIIISVVVSASVCSVSVQAKTRQKKPLTIAHRGYSGKYPENTLEAFKGAFENGFDGIEVDVWENKAGVMFVHHDSTTQRMTGKNVNIWDLKLSQRDKFPIISGTNISKFKKNSVLIPTLTETLEIVSENNGYVLLHLKSKSGYNMSKAGVKKIVRLIKRYKLKKKAIIMSGRTTVKRFLKYGNKVALLATSKDKKTVKGDVKWCKKKGVKLICATGSGQMKLFGSEKKYAKYLKKNGIKFGVYTTSNHKAYKRFTKINAKFAMSNDYVA